MRTRSRQGTLGGGGGEQRVDRVREGDLEGVADGLEDRAAVGFDGGAQAGVVAFEGTGHRLLVLLPALGRAFDVGEQEGDRGGGEGHGGAIRGSCAGDVRRRECSRGRVGAQPAAGSA